MKLMASTRLVGESLAAQQTKPRSITIGILTDAKLILQEARLRVSRGRPSRLDSRQSLKDAHHSVELVLRRKAEELGTKPYDFDALLKTMKGRGVSVPYERELEELNKSRVLAQHYGTVLDSKDAYRLVVAAENFMRDFLLAAFGVDYDSLSELETLGNEDVKGTLKRAQKMLDDGLFEDAAITAHLAVQKTKWIIERKLSPQKRRSRFSRFLLRFGDMELRDINDALNELSDAIEDTRDIAFSAPFAQDLKRLGVITGAAFLPIFEGEPVTQVMTERRDHEPTSDDAEFAVQLATEYALWADQTYGLSEDPTA